MNMVEFREEEEIHQDLDPFCKVCSRTYDVSPRTINSRSQAKRLGATRYGRGKCDECMGYFKDAESFDTDSCNCEVPKPRHSGVHPQSCSSCNLVIEAESRFDKLADKIAKEYRKDGDSAEKAKEIGEATAAKIGRRKYGKRRFEEMAHGAESFGAEEELTLKDVGISVYGNRPSLGGCRKCGGSLGSWDSDLRGFTHDDCEAWACVCASMGEDECEVHGAESFGAEGGAAYLVCSECGANTDLNTEGWLLYSLGHNAKVYCPEHRGDEPSGVYLVCTEKGDDGYGCNQSIDLENKGWLLWSAGSGRSEVYCPKHGADAYPDYYDDFDAESFSAEKIKGQTQSNIAAKFFVGFDRKGELVGRGKFKTYASALKKAKMVAKKDGNSRVVSPNGAALWMSNGKGLFQAGKLTAQAKEFYDAEEMADAYLAAESEYFNGCGGRHKMDAEIDDRDIWNPERAAIDSIRNNPELLNQMEEQGIYIGRHPGRYNDSGEWVEYIEHYEYKKPLPLWAQVGLVVGVTSGIAYFMKKIGE